MIYPHGIERVSAFNVDDGTTVQVNDIEAENSEFEQRSVDNDQVDATGNQYYGGDMSRLMVRGRESGSLFSQLKTWRDANTRLRYILQGPSFNVLWHEDDRLGMLRWIPIEGRAVGRSDFFDFEVIREGQGTHSILRQVNLLNHLADASGSTYDQAIAYPVAGPTVTASVAATGGTTGNLIVRAKNFASTTLQSSTQALTTSGRTSTSLVLPANTYSVQVEVTGDRTISDIALRTDGKTDFVAY